MPTRAKLAAIHIAKKQSGLSDAEYRRILMNDFQVESSAQLDDQSADSLVRRISSLGASPTVAKLWALWYNEIKPYLPEQEQNTFYFVGIVRKASGTNISCPNDFRRLTAKQIYKAIEALKIKADEFSQVPF